MNAGGMYMKNGTHDPFYPDGFNLNLICNHIAYNNRMIKEIYSKDRFFEQYYQGLSLEIDPDYIAKLQKILSNAV